MKSIEEVKAIPIEWIKKWISEHNDYPTMPYNQHIWNMIDDWEEREKSLDIMINIANRYDWVLGTAASDYAYELLKDLKNTTEFKRLQEYANQLEKVTSFEQQKELENRLRSMKKENEID